MGLSLLKLCLSKKNWMIGFFLIFVFPSITNATSAILVNDAKLKSKDNMQSKDLILLNKGVVVEIKNRNRGWYQVETQNHLIGWLTLLQVRFQTDLKGKGSSELSKLVSLRKGHSDITATTGVRGIGENDIKNATANFAALESTKQFKSSSTEAKKYAKELSLMTQTISYKESVK